MYVYHIYKTRWKYVNKVQQICWSKNASVLEIRWIERDTTKTITNLRHICLHYVYTSHIYIVGPVLYFGYIFFSINRISVPKTHKGIKIQKKNYLFVTTNLTIIIKKIIIVYPKSDQFIRLERSINKKIFFLCSSISSCCRYKNALKRNTEKSTQKNFLYHNKTTTADENKIVAYHHICIWKTCLQM